MRAGRGVLEWFRVTLVDCRWLVSSNQLAVASASSANRLKPSRGSLLRFIIIVPSSLWRIFGSLPVSASTAAARILQPLHYGAKEFSVEHEAL